MGEDDVLMREGIARLLEDAGFEIVARAGDAEDFARKVRAHKPDVAIVDVQMPPDGTDDGLRAATALRGEMPGLGVVVLSSHLEESYAQDLLGDDPQGVGYLLKERVGDVDAFVDAVRRVAAGGTALDPEVVRLMLGRSRRKGPIHELTPRELDVLSAMAEGRSNLGIAEQLVVTENAVEKHVSRIFRKLELSSSLPTDHRRVLAVLEYLRTAR